MQPALPADLSAELAQRGATVVETRAAKKDRFYVLAESSAGGLFARFSAHPGYPDLLAHELRIRSLIGSDLPLRAPNVLAAGAAWALETAVATRPFGGSEDVSHLVAAVAALMPLDLPPAPRMERQSKIRRAVQKLAPKRRESHPLWQEFERGLHLLRDIEEHSKLPRVTGHGDLTPSNVLMAPDGPWIVDWERLGSGPAGTDLLRFWPFVEDPQDRARLWDDTVDLVGGEHENDLAKLRYFYLLKAAVTKAGLRASTRNEDPVAAARLTELLPEVRAQAGLTESAF